MKVIIVGAGRIGRSLAKSLAEESNEVYLIDQREDRVRMVSEKLDVQVILGNGADPDILNKASVDKADLVLAVTTNDETNLVVCSLAGAFGAKRRIARVRNTALSGAIAEIGYKKFEINEIINPELVAAESIEKTIKAAGAHGVTDFGHGKIFLCSFDLSENSPLLGQTIGSFRDEDFPWPFLIVAIIRDEKVIIPKGDAILQEKDRIYVLLPKPSLAEFLTFINPDTRVPKKVLIYGASITGEKVAQDLSGHIKDVLLLEEDEHKAELAAGRLKTVRVIHGSATEADILTECGIEVVDIFVAASNDDQANMISAVLAKKMGAKTTIISSQKEDFLSIVEALDIDAIINPHYLAVEQILHLARGKGISSVTKLLDCDTEALEFIPEENSPVTQQTLKEIVFPKNSIVGAVYSGNEVTLATGDTRIKSGERVVVFCQEPAVKKLQKLFTSR